VLFALATTALAIGCSEGESNERQAPRLHLRMAFDAPYFRDPKFALRQRARFVEQHGVNRSGGLQGEPPFHKKTVWAALVVEMEATSGTASPSACGQATTRTATRRATGEVNFGPAASQEINVANPPATAMAVKYRAALSESA